MASNADWKNTDHTGYIAATGNSNEDVKDRKYSELTSDVFGTGAHKNFDREAPRTQFGSQADWMN